jgi:hypothetical protein
VTFSRRGERNFRSANYPSRQFCALSNCCKGEVFQLPNGYDAGQRPMRWPPAPSGSSHRTRRPTPLRADP